MNEIIDLTGDEKPAGVAAMEIDTKNPTEQQTSPRIDPGPSTAAPALGLNNAATAAAPALPQAVAPTSLVAPLPAPPNSTTASENELRYSQREKKPSRQRILMDRIGEQPQHLRMHRRNGRISVQEMQAHLETISIGLRPSDHTVSDLPDELPPPIHSSNCTADVEVINLSEWTQEKLNALAATTVTKPPFSMLLEEPPSAPKDRLGRFTGQQDRIELRAKQVAAPNTTIPHHIHSADLPAAAETEKKREKKVVSVAAGGAVSAAATPSRDDASIREYRINTLHRSIGVGVDVPWSHLGKSASLRAAGMDIPVIALWRAVQNLGGFQVVSTEKLWSAAARELGLDTKTFHGTSKLKDAYVKYLLPYELHLRHQGNPGETRVG